MPIEIMELVIKAKVSDQQSAANKNEAQQSNQAAAGGCEPTKAEKVANEILDILKRKNER